MVIDRGELLPVECKQAQAQYTGSYAPEEHGAVADLGHEEACDSGSDHKADVIRQRERAGSNAAALRLYLLNGKRGNDIADNSVFGTLCGILAPSLQSTAIDIIAGSTDGVFAKTVGLMFAVYVLYGVSQLLQGFISARLSQQIVKNMREQLFEKTLRLPVKYLDTHSHGDVMSRMTNDIENISSTVSQALPSLFSGILTLIGTVSIMFYYCWQLALLSCGVMLLTIGATKYLSVRVRKYSKRQQALLGMINGTVEEMTRGYKTIVAYNRQDETVDNFCKTADKMRSAGIRTNIYSGVMWPVMNFISNIEFVVIAAFGGYFAVRGYISVGVISAFIVYAKQFSRPVNDIAQIYGQIQTAIAGAERVFTVLDEENESMEGDELAECHEANISFDSVNFSYVPERRVINNFTLNIAPGKKVALVGSTGSGKTTVSNLLMRFYDTDSGTITINGQDISGVSRSSLRKRVSIVLQDTSLFTDTVRNNLKYANENASEAEIMRALEISHCRDFIEKLPDGLDTVLTGAGANLSQGQRQLLAIARAFVEDSEILILDEATSNVDTRTEKEIQDAMQRVMRSRTSLVIAHRLSTIRDSDLIIVMDHGKIVESGNHMSLLKQKGKYYELYMTQYAGFAT